MHCCVSTISKYLWPNIGMGRTRNFPALGLSGHKNGLSGWPEFQPETSGFRAFRVSGWAGPNPRKYSLKKWCLKFVLVKKCNFSLGGDMGWVFLVPKPSLKHVNNPHFPQKKCVFYRNLLARGPKKKGFGSGREWSQPAGSRAIGLARKARVFGLFGFRAEPDPTLIEI